MTTYYFHLRHSDGLVEDPGGSELADLEAAIEEAKSGARALVAVSIRENKLLQPTTIEQSGSPPDTRSVTRQRFRSSAVPLLSGGRLKSCATFRASNSSFPTTSRYTLRHPHIAAKVEAPKAGRAWCPCARQGGPDLRRLNTAEIAAT